MQSSASLAPSVVVQNVQNVALIGANSGTFDTSGVCTVGNGGPTSVLVLHGISAGFEFVRYRAMSLSSVLGYHP